MIEGLLSDEWIGRLAQYRRLFVGLSGGLDSTVLLHSLAQHPALLARLYAVHVHHGLSDQADVWQLHCEQFCLKLSVPMILSAVSFDATANIEARARTARYEIFSSLLKEGDALLLGHHANDQAETLLLNLFRGAGVDGLAAMEEIRPLKQGHLIRPLLNFPRHQLQAYAHWHQLKWIVDESNLNQAFSRNYLRHQVIPQIESRWPGAIQNLTRTAFHCQQARDNLKTLAEYDAVQLDLSARQLPLAHLCALEPRRLSNVLRAWLKSHTTHLPSAKILLRIRDEVVFAKADAKPCVDWQGIRIKRYQNTLYLLPDQRNCTLNPRNWMNFPEAIHLEIGTLKAVPAPSGFTRPKQTSQTTVQFRQGGERIHWRGQKKPLKKLMQIWRIPPWQRDQIPLVFIDGTLAAVVGYAVSDLFYGCQNSYQIVLCSH